jgi:hypothetical protein
LSVLLLTLAVCISSCEDPGTSSSSTGGASSSTPQVGVITWDGETEVTVILGDQVDLLEGITATDSIDGDITDKITIKDDGGFDKNLVGGYTVEYEVTNSTNVTSSFTREYTVVKQHNISNGEFDLGTIGWTFDKPGGAAKFEVQDNVGVVTITSPGNEWWALQLYQTGVILEGGYVYKISLEAKGSNRASISAGFENVNAGYAMMSNGMMAVELTDEMSKYEMYVKVNEDVTNAKMVIYMGYQLPGDEASEDEPSIIYVDNVNVSKLRIAENAPTFTGVGNVTITAGIDTFDPNKGVSVKDKDGNELEYEIVGVVPTSIRANGKYIISYRAKDANGVFNYYNRTVSVKLPKNYDYEVVNGDFSMGLTAWTQDVNQTNGTGQASFKDNEDGTVSINVTNVSDANWHIQLFQTGIKLEANEKYFIKAVVKADVERKIEIELSDPSNNYAVIAHKKIALTNEWQTFYVDFETAKSYGGAKLAFLLGNVENAMPGTITVDEFQISKYAPFNSEFTTTYSPWVLDNITAEVVKDGENGVLVVTFEENKLGNNPWDHQLYQNKLQLKAGLQYKISVRLKASIDRNIKIWLEDAARGYAAIDTSNTFSLVADEYQECKFIVTITEELETYDCKFVIMFGDPDAKAAHTVTVDYFRVDVILPTE